VKDFVQYRTKYWNKDIIALLSLLLGENYRVMLKNKEIIEQEKLGKSGEGQ